MSIRFGGADPRTIRDKYLGICAHDGGELHRAELVQRVWTHLPLKPPEAAAGSHMARVEAPLSFLGSGNSYFFNWSSIF